MDNKTKQHLSIWLDNQDLPLSLAKEIEAFISDDEQYWLDLGWWKIYDAMMKEKK